MILWGWLRRPVVLAMKADLCPSCGGLQPHAIVRQLTWGHVFWIPILLLWVSHRLFCTNCGHEEKLGWRETRRALKEGRLPRPRRPQFREWAQGQFDTTNRMPQESELEAIEVNPARGPWDLWSKLWPIVVSGLLLFAVLDPLTRPAPVTYVPAEPHACWLAADDTVAGCRLLDGSIDGVLEGRQTTCWFAEPMPTGALRCND